MLQRLQSLQILQNWYVWNTHASKAAMLKTSKSLIEFAHDRNWFVNLKLIEHCNKMENKKQHCNKAQNQNIPLRRGNKKNEKV